MKVMETFKSRNIKASQNSAHAAPSKFVQEKTK